MSKMSLPFGFPGSVWHVSIAFSGRTVAVHIGALGKLTKPLKTRSQQTFSIKVSRANILGFAGQAVSVTTIQLCSHTKAAIDGMRTKGMAVSQ